MQTAAPSACPDEVAAVIVPSGLYTGASEAIFSYVVSARGP